MIKNLLTKFLKRVDNKMDLTQLYRLQHQNYEHIEKMLKRKKCANDSQYLQVNVDIQSII